MNSLWAPGGPSYIFVGGKGGVGKTTTSCALAMRLAAEGKRTLLISTDPAHNCGDALGVRLSGKISHIVGSPGDNLFAIEVAPGEVVTQILGLDKANAATGEGGGTAATTASNSASAEGAYQAPLPLDFNELPNHMQAIAKEASEWAKSFPGIDETMTLVKVVESLELSQFGVVVFDTAPTGHTLRLLSLPSILQDAVQRLQSWRVKLANYISMIGNFFSSSSGSSKPNMNLATLATKLKELKVLVEKLQVMFSDPVKTVFIPVMIAESLSVLETERLVSQLHIHQIPTRLIVVNQLIDPAYIDAKKQIENGTDENEGEKSMERQALELCAARAQLQQHYLAEIYKIFGNDHTIVEVPALTNEPKGQEGLKKFASFWDAGTIKKSLRRKESKETSLIGHAHEPGMAARVLESLVDGSLPSSEEGENKKKTTQESNDDDDSRKKKRQKTT